MPTESYNLSKQCKLASPNLHWKFCKNLNFVTKFRAPRWGIPFERRFQKRVGLPIRSRDFTSMDSSNVKTVALYKLAVYHNKHCWRSSFPAVPTSMTLNDLKPSKQGFSWFFGNFCISKVNCAEMVGDGDFSCLNFGSFFKKFSLNLDTPSNAQFLLLFTNLEWNGCR